MSNSQKKTIWSLQDNKRSESEREAFKPTGKKPKSKTPKYVAISLLVLLVLSFLLIKIYDEPLETCITATFCINSKDDIGLYTLYVFFTISILIASIAGAYAIGKHLGNKIKV